MIVNRYWAMFFGRGLVATLADFGNQGRLPSHPQLLDWLATTFVDSGWNLKALQKRIVLSATYRQDSRLDAKRLEQDPANEWLARGPSYRLAAEQIRDSALAASGLLVRTVGGPSVYPYQPPGLWEALATRNATKYEQGTGQISIAAASTPSGSGRRRRRRRSASTRRSGSSAPSTASARIRRCSRWCC